MRHEIKEAKNYESTAVKETSAMRFAQAVVRSSTTLYGEKNFRGFQHIMR